MSANSFGERFRISTFGESHGVALGVLIDGCPAGVTFDENLLINDLKRRRPGSSEIVSSRQEEDFPEVLSGVFQGAGDTRLPMILSIIALWVFEFPLAYILSHHTGLNEVGIWLASPIAAGIIAIVTYTLFRRGRWKEMRLIQDEDVALERQVKRAAQIEEGI